VAAFFSRRQLVFEVNTGSTGLDHLLHEFESVQRAAEAGFRIGNDRSKPVGALLAPVEDLNLIGPTQRVVDAFDHRRHTVGRIKTLVGIHFTRQVGVGCNLPAAQIDRLQPGFDLLNGLIACKRPQGGNIALLVQKIPEAFGADPGKGVLDVQIAPQFENLFNRVRASDPFPARIVIPALLKFRRFPGHDLTARQSLTDLFRFFCNGFHLFLPSDRQAGTCMCCPNRSRRMAA
jgi:hypothetical protein